MALVLLSHPNTTQASGLEGQVVDESNQPVQDISVFIYTGKPKKGPAVLCPYCYVDFGKQTQTDQDVAFTFGSVDDALTFKLLLVKKEQIKISVHLQSKLRERDPLKYQICN